MGDRSSYKKNKARSRRRCRFLRLPRMRIRICSRVHIIYRIRELCLRFLVGKSSCPSSFSFRGVLSEPCSARSSSFYEDAIADCIKFIKQSAAAESRPLIY